MEKLLSLCLVALLAIYQYCVRPAQVWDIGVMDIPGFRTLERH